MKASHIGMLAAAVVGFGFVSAAEAQNVTWGTPTTIVGDSDVSVPAGSTVVKAYVFGTGYVTGGSNVALVNGVQFVGFDNTVVGGTSTNTATGDTLSDPANPGSFGGYGFFTNGATDPVGVSSQYHQLLTNGDYGDSDVRYNNPTNPVLTLNGLSIGTKYQIQLWVNDSRVNGANPGFNETYTGGTGLSAPVFGNSGAGGTVGQYVIGTFTANSSSESIFIGGQQDANSAYKGWQLNAADLLSVSGSSVPEPASLSLLAIGGAALLARRNRRHA